VTNTRLVWRSAFSQFPHGLVEGWLRPPRRLEQHLLKLRCRKDDNPVPTEFDLPAELLARSRTDASNRLEDANRALVTGLETRKLSIQVLTVQDGSMLVPGKKTSFLKSFGSFSKPLTRMGIL
jgi:hypothetical protein